MCCNNNVMTRNKLNLRGIKIMKSILHLSARFLIALIFLLSGVGKLFGFDQTAQMMTSVGFPAAKVFLASAIALELIGGFALLLGYKARYAAGALFLFLIPATLIFHAAFISDPVHGQEQVVNVLKNLAIMGGLLRVVADGAGLFSLDSLFERKQSLQPALGTAGLQGVSA